MLNGVNKARNCRICTINKTKSVFSSPFICLFVHFFRSLVPFICSKVRFWIWCCCSAHTHMFASAMKVNLLGAPIHVDWINRYMCVWLYTKQIVSILCWFVALLLRQPSFPFQFQTIRVVSNANQNIHRRKQKSTHHTKCMPNCMPIQKPTAPMPMTKQRVRSRNGMVFIQRTNERSKPSRHKEIRGRTDWVWLEFEIQVL